MPLVWRWQLLPEVPLIHQEHEALADLMEYLRCFGAVLIGRPRRQRIDYEQRPPQLVFDCEIRDWTSAERRVLDTTGPVGASA